MWAGKDTHQSSYPLIQSLNTYNSWGLKLEMEEINPSYADARNLIP